MRDMAEELLKLYAARKAVPGHPFGPDTHWQEEFEDAFEYSLTPDQATAVADIVNAGTITSSPGPTPIAPIAANKPDVAEFMETACLTLKCLHQASSKARTHRPPRNSSPQLP